MEYINGDQETDWKFCLLTCSLKLLTLNHRAFFLVTGLFHWPWFNLQKKEQLHVIALNYTSQDSQLSVSQLSVSHDPFKHESSRHLISAKLSKSMFACLAQETQCLYPKVLTFKHTHIHICGNARCICTDRFTKVMLYSVEVNGRGTFRNEGLSNSVRQGQVRIGYTIDPGDKTIHYLLQQDELEPPPNRAPNVNTTRE